MSARPEVIEKLLLMLVISYLAAGFVHSAAAAMIGTQAAITAQERELRITSVQVNLAREDVRAQMINLGVDPARAAERVAALTDEELMGLESELDKLPAGAGLLEVIGIVFVVLLILELTGVTDSFKKL
jgi:hypothetical protein